MRWTTWIRRHYKKYSSPWFHQSIKLEYSSGRKSRSSNRTWYKIARLDQSSVTMGYHKHSAGKLSQDVWNQFLSGEGNPLACYQQKALLHWTHLSLLRRLLHFLLLSGATHPLYSKTSMSGGISHDFQEKGIGVDFTTDKISINKIFLIY